MNELEFVFKKIIEIDTKVATLQTDTEKEISEKESTHNQELESLDEKLLNTLKIELKKEHENAISSSQEKARLLLEESKNLSKNMLEEYMAIKDDLKEQIIKDMIISY